MPRTSADITVMISIIFCVIISLIGVRLNKPYSVRVPMDIPVFTGTHADFLVIVSIFVSTRNLRYVYFFMSCPHELFVRARMFEAGLTL